MTHAASLTAPAVAAETRGSDYSELMRRIRGAGLLDRRHAYYFTKIGIMAGLLLGGWALFAIMGDSWWQIAVAALLAFVFAQLGFIGHDAGHGQIFRTKRANYLVGLLHGNLAIGLSYGWWVDKHNRHHSHPNEEGRDPDIAVGALAFTGRQAGVKRGLLRFIARYQAFLFFPLTLLEGLQLHVSSVRALSRRGLRYRAGEAALLLVHAAVLLHRGAAGAPAAQGARLRGHPAGALRALPRNARSPPTTRACRSWRPAPGSTSCAARCSPRATCAAAGSPTSCWAA